jgi:thiamine-monophosphate kinase
MRELDLIQRIRERHGSASGVETGIGDDAAVLRTAGGDRLVVTTDLLVEGTHYRPGDPARDVGRKLVMVSVSDVAAMGCRATGALVAVALRREHMGEWALDLLAGIEGAAAECGVPLIGGDTTETTGPAALCSTVIGEAPPGRRPVLRSGAVPGHALLVTGDLGGSLAGRHLRFRARQAEALELVGRCEPGAMIDVSDGLSTDAWHLARESGVTIRIAPDQVPVSPVAQGLADPLRHALEDGEDFELLFTVPAAAAEEIERSGLAGTPVTRIGEVLEGDVQVLLGDEPLDAGGYEHFGRERPHDA